MGNGKYPNYKCHSESDEIGTGMTRYLYHTSESWYAENYWILD
jgi:hypothetical protein